MDIYIILFIFIIIYKYPITLIYYFIYLNENILFNIALLNIKYIFINLNMFVRLIFLYISFIN